MVLNNVDPKKRPAAKSIHLVGCTSNQALKDMAMLKGSGLLMTLNFVSDKGFWNALLQITHSENQNIAMIPANVRSNATLGTST